MEPRLLVSKVKFRSINLPLDKCENSQYCSCTITTASARKAPYTNKRHSTMLHHYTTKLCIVYCCREHQYTVPPGVTEIEILQYIQYCKLSTHEQGINVLSNAVYHKICKVIVDYFFNANSGRRHFEFLIIKMNITINK